MNFVRFAMNTMDLILKLLKENNKEQEVLSLYDSMTDAQKAEFIIKFNEFINERRR